MELRQCANILVMNCDCFGLPMLVAILSTVLLRHTLNYLAFAELEDDAADDGDGAAVGLSRGLLPS